MAKAQRKKVIQVDCLACGARHMVDIETGDVEAYAGRAPDPTLSNPDPEPDPIAPDESAEDLEEVEEDDDDWGGFGDW